MSADSPNPAVDHQETQPPALNDTLSVLQATIESAPYGILVVDLAGKIILLNQKFATLWSFPAAVLARQDLWEMAQYSASQVKDPQGYLRRIKDRLAQQGPEAVDLIELKDGRIFERQSFPRRLQGQCVGTVANLRDITANHRTELTLQQQQHLLTTLVRDLPGMAYRCAHDLNWTMLFVSAGCRELTGYEPAEMERNRTVAYDDLVHTNDRAGFGAKRQASLDARAPCENTYRIVDRAGKTRWVHERAEGDYAADGQLIAIDGFIQDITERKATDTALAQTVRALAEAQRIARLGSWRLDVASNHVVWTEELYRMYGFDPTRPVPAYTESAKLFTPGSWQLLSDAIAHCRETGTSYELELETVRQDGSRGWMLARGERVQDASGATVELHGVAQDITERKNAESERDRLFNLSQDLICVANYQGYFTQVNPAWTRILGWAQAELTSRPWLDFVHPDDYASSVNASTELVDGQAVLRFENRYRHQDGSYRWLQWNAFPLPEAKILFGIARDITAQKEAEVKMNAQLAELQRWQSVTLGREDRVKELKREVNELLIRHGEPPRYGA